jgi:hypothetical protein
MKSLVLDIDGVLLRDKLLAEHVKYNVVQYVRTKIPKCKDPERINRFLYRTYGHTAKGLEHAYNIDASDFNKKVYNSRLMSHLWEILSGTEFQKEASIIHDISNKGWKVSLFSNSPLEWSTPVARAINDRIDTKIDDHFLKPDVRSYMQFNPRDRHLFVDDKTVNLRTASTLGNWIPIHFSTNPVEDPEFLTIDSIHELSRLIEIIQF